MSVGMGPVTPRDPAPVAQRVAAAAVDLLPVPVLLIGAVLIAAVTSWPWWAPLLPVAAALAWVVLLWWTATADGRTPGKRWRGLVEVDERSGGTPASGSALLRLLLRGGLILVTAGIAGLSYRWDPAGRQRTWWDRLAGTAVFDGASRRRPEEAVIGWAPAGPAAAPVSSARPAAAPVASAGPGGGWVPGADPEVTAPVSAAGIPRPAELRGSQGRPAPVPPVSVPRSGRVRPPAGDFLAPPLIGGDRRPVPPAPTGARHRAPDAVPAAAPSPPSAFPPPSATLVWDTGRRVVLAGRILIGRDPVPADGERVDHLLPVTTESIGVSKTHLQIDVGPTGILLTDRRSTNGTRIVHPDGSGERCTPGAPMAARPGDAVYFGGRCITIAR